MHLLASTSCIIILNICLILPSTSSLSTVQEKSAKLVELSHKSPVIRMNSALFKDLVKSPPRDYSVVLMLTALSSRRGCSVCQAAADEFEMVASSWVMSMFAEEDRTKLFFALADFDEAEEVFQMLNMQTAPVFMHFPAVGKQKAQDTMNIQREGFEAEVISKWVQERTGIQIRVVRKPNYFYLMLLSISFCFFGAIVYLRQSTFGFLWNRQIYAIGALFVITYFTSGQMWNHIRGPPLMSRHPQTGQYMYIANSTQSQFALESYLIMTVELLTAVGFILLIEAGRKSNDSSSDVRKNRNRVLAMVGGGFVVFFFSLLLSIFRAKFQGYPYMLLFK